MCRYGEHTYKNHFACFRCRKTFKRRPEFEWSTPPNKGEPVTFLCPQCGVEMADMGRDFKAPKQINVKQWKKVEILYQHGFTYHSCGCCGPGLRPKELHEVEDFLIEKLSKSEGKILL